MRLARAHNFSPVVPGLPDPYHCTVVIPAGVAGVPTVGSITLRDSFDNVRTGNNDAPVLAATIAGANPGACAIVPDTPGVYRLSYTPVVNGIDLITVRVNGSPIYGSPFVVIAGPVFAPTPTTAVISSGSAGLPIFALDPGLYVDAEGYHLFYTDIFCKLPGGVYNYAWDPANPVACDISTTVAAPAYAFSSDKGLTWQFRGPPVLVPGAGDTYDASKVETPSLFLLNGTLYLLYSAEGKVGGAVFGQRYQIGCASLPLGGLSVRTVLMNPANSFTRAPAPLLAYNTTTPNFFGNNVQEPSLTVGPAGDLELFYTGLSLLLPDKAISAPGQAITAIGLGRAQLDPNLVVLSQSVAPLVSGVNIAEVKYYDGSYHLIATTNGVPGGDFHLGQELNASGSLDGLHFSAPTSLLQHGGNPGVDDWGMMSPTLAVEASSLIMFYTALGTNQTPCFPVPANGRFGRPVLGGTGCLFATIARAVAARVVFAPDPLRDSILKYPTPAEPTASRSFYFDTVNGSDANNGLTTGAPFKTLEKVRTTAQPGDRFYGQGTANAANGSGTLGGSTWPSGTNGTPIQLYQWPGGAPLVLDGGGVSLPTIWGTANMHDWYFNGVRIRSTGGFGPEGFLTISGVARFLFVGCTLDGCEVHLVPGYTDIWFYNGTVTGVVGVQGFSGGGNSGDFFFVQGGSRFKWIRMNYVNATAWHSAGTISYNQGFGEATADDFVIAGCDVQNLGAGGIIINGKANRGILELLKIHNIARSGPAFTATRVGVQLMGTGVILRYSEIYDCYEWGVSVQSYTQGSFLQPASNLHVYHNTIYGNGGGPFQLLMKDNGRIDGLLIENNLCWGNHKRGATSLGGFADGQYWEGAVVDQYNANPGNPYVWTTTFCDGAILRNNFMARTASNTDGFAIIIRNPTNFPPGNLYKTLATAASDYAWVNNRDGEDPAITFEDPFNPVLLPQSTSPELSRGYAIVTPEVVAFKGTAPTPGRWELGG